MTNVRPFRKLREDVLSDSIAKRHQARTGNINQIGSVARIVRELLPDIEAEFTPLVHVEESDFECARRRIEELHPIPTVENQYMCTFRELVYKEAMLIALERELNQLKGNQT